MKKVLLFSAVLSTCLLAACSRPEAGKSKALNPITAAPGDVVATRNVDYELPETEEAPEGYISSYDTGDSSGGRSVEPGYYSSVAEVAEALPVTAQHDEDHGAPHGEDASHEAEDMDHGDTEDSHSGEETQEGHSEEAAEDHSEDAPTQAETDDEGIIETVTEAAAGAAAAVAGTVEDGVDAAGNVIESAGDAVAEGVETTREAVAEGVEAAGEAVENASEAVADVIEPETETAAQEASEPEAATPETEEAEPANETEEEPASEEAPSTEAQGEATPVAVFDWQELGESTYSANCVSCHQATGLGIVGAFPPLAGHIPDLYNAEGGREYIINVVLYGLQGEINVEGNVYNGIMTPWSQLSDEEIAATLNHELMSWGNDALVTDFTPILPEEVTALRGQGLAPADVLSLRPALAE